MIDHVVRGPLLVPAGNGSVTFHADGALAGDAAGVLRFVGAWDALRHQLFNNAPVRRSDGVVLPPLLDVHMHVSQHPIRGRFVEGVPDDAPGGKLLNGLRRNVFPAEVRCADQAVAEQVVRDFLADTLAHGVVGGASYMTPSAVATEVALSVLPETWSVGLVLMNRDCPPALCTNEATLQADVERLAARFGRPPRPNLHPSRPPSPRGGEKECAAPPRALAPATCGAPHLSPRGERSLRKQRVSGDRAKDGWDHSRERRAAESERSPLTPALSPRGERGCATRPRGRVMPRPTTSRRLPHGLRAHQHRRGGSVSSPGSTARSAARCAEASRQWSLPLARRPISRRAFLRNTSATAASVVAARALGAPATAPITTQPAGRLNVGFVGVAGKATGSIEALAKAGANVVALCDIDGHRLGKAADKYPHAKTYADFRKMLEQRDVEAVCVTTPDHTHAPAALAALALGKPVYCEKPLTHNVREARLLTEAARKARVATQMGNQGHAAAGTRAQVEAVQSGAIGAVTEVHVWTNRPVWPQGIDRPTDTPPVPGHIAWDQWLGPAPERPYHPSYHPFKWRGFWAFGTGALGDMGCHLLDAPFWALDLRDPTWVEATATGATAESAPKSSVVTYHFPARGGRGAVKLVWYDGGELPPAELVDGRVLKGENADKAYRDGGVVYVGERGRLMAAYLKAPEMLGPDGKDFKQPDPSLPRSVGHYREWIDACVDATPAGSNFDYAGPLTETVLLGNVALRAGTRIEWDANAMRVTNLPAADALITREYRKGWEI